MCRIVCIGKHLRISSTLLEEGIAYPIPSGVKYMLAYITSAGNTVSVHPIPKGTGSGVRQPWFKGQFCHL